MLTTPDISLCKCTCPRIKTPNSATPDSVHAGEPTHPKPLTSGASPLVWRTFRIVVIPSISSSCQT